MLIMEKGNAIFTINSSFNFSFSVCSVVILLLMSLNCFFSLCCSYFSDWTSSLKLIKAKAAVTLQIWMAIQKKVFGQVIFRYVCVILLLNQMNETTNRIYWYMDHCLCYISTAFVPHPNKNILYLTTASFSLVFCSVSVLISAFVAAPSIPVIICRQNV